MNPSAPRRDLLSRPLARPERWVGRRQKARLVHEPPSLVRAEHQEVRERPADVDSRSGKLTGAPPGSTDTVSDTTQWLPTAGDWRGRRGVVSDTFFSTGRSSRYGSGCPRLIREASPSRPGRPPLPSGRTATPLARGAPSRPNRRPSRHLEPDPCAGRGGVGSRSRRPPPFLSPRRSVPGGMLWTILLRAPSPLTAPSG